MWSFCFWKTIRKKRKILLFVKYHLLGEPLSLGNYASITSQRLRLGCSDNAIDLGPLEGAPSPAVLGINPHPRLCTKNRQEISQCYFSSILKSDQSSIAFTMKSFPQKTVFVRVDHLLAEVFLRQSIESDKVRIKIL